MVFTRLSALVPPAPLERTASAEAMPTCTLHRGAVPGRHGGGRSRVSILAGSLILLPILAAMTLSLFALLTPTTHLRTGLVTIRPIGRPSATIERSTSVSASFAGPASASATLTLGPSIIDPSQSGEVNKTGTVLSAPIDISNVTRVVELNATTGKPSMAVWYGESGPSMWIGMIQVCLRNTSNAGVDCAFVSHLANYAEVLPGDLGFCFQDNEMSTSGPVLTLLSTVALALATLVLIGGWLGPFKPSCCPRVCALPWARRYPTLEERDGHRYSSSDSESLITLVERPRMTSEHEKDHQPIPHCAFGILSSIAFVLSVVGAGLEMKVVNNLIGSWNSQVGEEIGLILELGPMTILLCCAPVFILLALTAAYAPILVRRCTKTPVAEREGSTLGGAAVSAHHDISPLLRAPTTATPTPLTISVDGEKRMDARRSVVEVRNPNAPSAVHDSNKTKARSSWRYTLQSLVGVAV